MSWWKNPATEPSRTSPAGSEMTNVDPRSTATASPSRTGGPSGPEAPHAPWDEITPEPPAPSFGESGRGAGHRLGIHPFVAVDHLVGVEVRLDVASARDGVDEGCPLDGRGKLVRPVAGEARDPVDHELGHRAPSERHHGGPARHGFQHHQAEGLLPLDRGQEAARPGVQIL